MRKLYCIVFIAVVALFLSFGSVMAQSPSVRRPTAKISPVLREDTEATASATISATLTVSPTETPRPDLTKETETTVEPLKKLLDNQPLGNIFPNNFIKYAIRASVDSGVPPNTIVLLLLLPGVAALIAAARHLIGLRGFGIFLPAALSVVFLATGPIVGIGLFLIIVFVSTTARIVMRKFKIKLQYLPRMALILHFVVLGILGILFLSPLIKNSSFLNVSIFPVLILVLLAEDFTKVQLGKSVRVALNLTTETLILALLSFIFLNLKFIQEFALLSPEIWILLIIVIDYYLGKYVGLRVIEYWRFRKLIKS